MKGKHRSRSSPAFGFKPSFTNFSVFVLSLATIWVMYQVYLRKFAASSNSKMFSMFRSSQNLAEELEAEELYEEDELAEVDSQNLELGPYENHTRVPILPRKSRMPNLNNTFKMQLERLLATPVPIILSKSALNSKASFSCGGSHVVKLSGYKEIRSFRHVEDVLPQYDMFYASRNDKIFSNCAVVGNSGSMLEAEHGQEIDAHDVVIRFNAGITEGYEQFVGSKTTFRMLNNPESRAKERGEITISTLRDDDMKTWAASVLQHADMRSHSALCADPEFLCYTWQWVRNTGHKPSTGLVGLVLALKICRKVTIYGFQSSNYFSRTSRPHYYDWERPAKGRERVHPFAREVALYKQLHKYGFISMVTP